MLRKAFFFFRFLYYTYPSSFSDVSIVMLFHLYSIRNPKSLWDCNFSSYPWYGSLYCDCVTEPMTMGLRTMRETHKINNLKSLNIFLIFIFVVFVVDDPYFDRIFKMILIFTEYLKWSSFSQFVFYLVLFCNVV